ncbi:hypothetical protein ACSBR1_030152 [Camellia fascicularis]
MVVDPEGRAGGLLCVWNPRVFKLRSCCSSKSFIFLSGTILPSVECVLMNVYAPNDVAKRGRLWEAIIRLKLDFTYRWILGGDFNEIKSIGERKGCLRRDRGMRDFNSFIQSMEVTDLVMLGRRFTWCNAVDGDKWSRIDLFLISPEWLQVFKLKQWGLPRSVSNHCPIILMEDAKDWGPRLFRFINAWTLHSQFLSVVKHSWEEAAVTGWASYVIYSKLKALRIALKTWNLEVFGNVKHKLKEAEEELHSLDLCAEYRDLDDSEKSRRQALKGEVWLWRKKDE